MDEQYIIRNATTDDMKIILSIYEYAREQMKQNGNPNQWKDDRPTVASIEKDLQEENLYVVEENVIQEKEIVDQTNHENNENNCNQNKRKQPKQIVGVFALVIGDDPTYQNIENGAWLNEEPYGTIHKIAAVKGAKNILKTALAFCESKIDNLRIDTHEDNQIMQHLIEKYGFQKCGIIYVDDGSPRIAYQRELRLK